jgi:hypothetical protein
MIATVTPTDALIAFLLTVVAVWYIVIFGAIWLRDEQRKNSNAPLAGSAAPQWRGWQARLFNGFKVYGADVIHALCEAAEKGRVLEITYRDANNEKHTRTVELWEYDAERQVLRTREIGTCHFRQVIAPYVLSVRWVGDFGSADAPLRYDADALAALDAVDAQDALYTPQYGGTADLLDLLPAAA